MKDFCLVLIAALPGSRNKIQNKADIVSNVSNKGRVSMKNRKEPLQNHFYFSPQYNVSRVYDQTLTFSFEYLGEK